MKRATNSMPTIKPSGLFQSTPSWRGRRIPKLRSIFSSIFQSTPSWRGRLWRCFFCPLSMSYFNPRPHEEGDEIFQACHSCLELFQSTPSWRGRQYRWRAPETTINFNPRPHEEGDVHFLRLWGFWRYFNPRPHEEGDKTIYKRTNTL